jgi:hypothetical protein
MYLKTKKLAIKLRTILIHKAHCDKPLYIVLVEL